VSVVGLHHAGVYVASLERSLAFYGEVFGLTVAERFEFGGESLAFLRAGAGFVELIESTVPGSRSTGVIDHVALEVDNLDELVLLLRQHGVTLLDPAPLPVPRLSARILFCEGPDRERIELLEVSIK
jgi:lactoylglutathione lyase